MARNRVIYQSEALYVSDAVDSLGTGTNHQLSRIQSANISYDMGGSRQDVNQFGELARIDSVVTDTPSVSLDFTYYLTNGLNENNLGFYVQTGSASQASFISGALTDVSGRNFYMVSAIEGTDANLLEDSVFDGNLWQTGANSAILSYIGVGNAFLSDYTIDAAVGDFPTVSVTVEGLNANAGNDAHTCGYISTDEQAISDILVGYGPYDSYLAPYPYQFALGYGLAGYADGVPWTGQGPNGLGPEFNNFTGQTNDVYSGIANVLLPSIFPTLGTKYVDPIYLGTEVDGPTETGGVYACVLPKPIEQTGASDFGSDDNSVTTLRAGDIVLDLGNFDASNNPNDGPFVKVDGADGVCVQNFSLSIPLSRSTIDCLGSRFAKSRAVDFPVTATLTVSALVNELTSGNLVDVLNSEGEHDINIQIKKPNDATTNSIRIDFLNAKFDGEAYSSSVGPNKTVDLTFTTQVGGVNDTTHGVLMSGSY